MSQASEPGESSTGFNRSITVAALIVGPNIYETGNINELRKRNSEAEMVALINQMPGDIFANAQFAAADLRKEFNAMLPTHRDFWDQCQMPSYVFCGQNPERAASAAKRNLRTRSNMWATPTGLYATRNTHARYYDYDIGSTGLAFGKTWQLNNNRMIGIAFGYDYARVEMQGVAQNDDMQSFDLAIYGGKHELRGDFTDWHIGYAKNGHDTKRIVGGTINESNYHDNVFSFGITTGRHIGIWTPSIGVEAIQVWSPAHTEFGGSIYSLNVNRSRYTSLEIPIGTRLSKTLHRRCGADLTPELRAFWVPQLGDTSSSMRASFASGGSDFLVDSGKFGGSHGRFGAGLTFKFKNSLSASVNYDAAVYTGQTRQIATTSMTLRF